ncbi:MAG: hypothetical protein BRC36_03880 [Cyanobacteria bacterium QH_2_48_84]|nr:MAG: hypothetical protein BRC36_03880 [Cyanobacteria bacterium QH_2_48_84]
MFESGQVLQDRYQLQQKLGQTMAGRQTWLAVDFSTQPNESVFSNFWLLVLKKLKSGLLQALESRLVKQKLQRHKSLIVRQVSVN